MPLRTALLSALLLAAPAIAETSAPSPAAATEDSAQLIAAAMGPQEQFRSFVRATLDTTVTGRTIVGKLGAAPAAALFDAETAKVVAKYGPEWEANLAASYREALTPAELVGAMAAVFSRDGAAMMPLMAKVGPVMQRKSTPLLEKAALEALNGALASSPATMDKP